MKHIAWWWSLLGNQCNGLLLHWIKLVFEKVKHWFHVGIWLWGSIVFVAIGGCINIFSLKIIGYLCKNDCSGTIWFCKKTVSYRDYSWEPFWIELGEMLHGFTGILIFKILCKSKRSWWGTLCIYYIVIINSWKLNKCSLYDILPLTAWYINL